MFTRSKVINLWLPISDSLFSVHIAMNSFGALVNRVTSAKFVLAWFTSDAMMSSLISVPEQKRQKK